MCLSEEGPALLAHRAGIRLHTIRRWLSVALKFGEIFWLVVDWGKRGGDYSGPQSRCGAECVRKRCSDRVIWGKREIDR